MNKNLSLLLFSFLSFIICGSVKAVTNTASVSGAWETAANWSLGHVPLATEDVVIPNAKAMTVNAADVCLSLTINSGGSLTINAARNLSIAGNFSNAGTFTATNAGSSITFNAAVNSMVTGSGTYTMAGTIVLNMGAVATSLDVQSSNFCAALSGNFTLTQGTWKMDNTGTLANMYTAANKLIIPNKVVIESDQGTMNFCNTGTTGNILLEGELFMNGGTVNVASLQGFNAGQDFQYKVVGGISPILKSVSGNLYVFAGFNPNTAADYINFNMSGGTITCAYSTGGIHGGYSNNGTFQLQNVVGGQTVMTGGTIVLEDADNSATQNDLDMGGANVAATNYSVTGGTVQFGGATTQASSTFFGISPYATTNYPNFNFAAGTAKSASPYFSNATLNLLSLNVGANMTFDISPNNNNINFMSNNGTFALQVLGSLINGIGSYTFSGGANQLITSNLATLTFPSLIIANTGGATSTFGGSLTTITSGALTLTSGNLTPGTVTSYTINGITTLTSGTFTAPTTISQNGNWINNGGTFIPGTGTVSFIGAAAKTLGGTSSTTFYNLTCNGGTVTLGNNETIKNTLLISTGTLDASASNYSLTVGQNFTNNATFNGRSGLVTMTGNTSTPLNINGTTSTSFYNLTLNPANNTDVVLLGLATTVNNNLTISKGIFNSQNFQITGNATGTMSMAANTGLLLGLTTVASNTLFPTAFTAAHCALNVTSTVTYQANSNQTVSSVPTYGNVILTNGNRNSNKTPTGTPTTIAGNLTLSKGAGNLTLRQINNSIILGGNFTSNGRVLFGSGNFNIGGNFLNNGTFNAGTGTVTFDGTANQFLGGTTATTFYVLTINNTGSATITLGNNTTVGSNFTITQGTFDVSASNYSLNVAGNFSNSGGFTAHAGTVTLNGAANQNMAGSSLTAFYNLSLPSARIVTLNHNESVAGVLTLTGATTLNGPDSMITISNASGTARIAQITTGAIGANFIMQRYVTGTVANYQALGSPARADILKDWAYDPFFYMSGVGGPYGNAIKNGRVYYSVNTFNETTNTYDSVNTVNQPLTPGLGLYLWMGNSLTSFAPFTFETKGIPNVGNINHNVTKNNAGNNLISNPYESPINWTSFQAGNSARIGNTFYCFDETTGNWESSNGVTASGGRLVSNPNIIPAHQAFMVICTSAGVLTFREAHKSVTDASVIRLEEPTGMIRISLTTNANTFSGHAIIQFSDSASDSYSSNEDALHIHSLTENAPFLYTFSSDGEKLINNTLPANADAKDVTFYAGGKDEGMYNVQFNGINSISKYNCILLEDVQRGKWMQVTEGSTYSFYDASNGQENKFILHFKTLQPGQDCTIPENSTVSNEMDGIDIFSSQVGAQVKFSFQTTQDVTISVYNMLGEKVGEDMRCSAWNNTIQVPLPSTNAIYIVRVIAPAGVKNQRVYR